MPQWIEQTNGDLLHASIAIVLRKYPKNSKNTCSPQILQTHVTAWKAKVFHEMNKLRWPSHNESSQEQKKAHGLKSAMKRRHRFIYKPFDGYMDYVLSNRCTKMLKYKRFDRALCIHEGEHKNRTICNKIMKHDCEETCTEQQIGDFE